MFIRRTGQETVERPPEGSDSCYGVRSLSSSVWSEGSDADVEVEGGGGGENEGFRPNATTSQPITIAQRGPLDGEDEATAGSFGSNETMTPMPPRELLPPLQPHFDTQSTEGYRRVSLAELPSIPQTPETDDDDDGPSVPSSPASLAFSCIASLSSLSRTSSPVSGVSGLERRPIGLGIGGEDHDLVVPTLSLPNSSLHMSFRKWDGLVGDTIKLGLVGTQEHVAEVLRGLQSDGVQLVDTDKGVGVLRADRVHAVIVTAATAEQMRRRVNEGYAAFDGLINPSLPRAKDDEIRKLAEAYAGKSDWIHAAVVIDSDEPALEVLASVVPVVTALPTKALTLDLCESRAPTPSPPKLGDDPTPMPSVSRAESYFALPTSHSPSLLHQVLDHESGITKASLTAYLCWRGGDHTPLHSSVTSATSPLSSSFGAHQPMPTVARAQGGAQWEAEVSRREANSRRLKHHRRPSAREEYYLDKRRRRTCGPNLFPKGQGRSPRFISSTGLGEVVNGLWGFARDVKGWKWGLAAAAVLFVGLGLDYFRTR